VAFWVCGYVVAHNSITQKSQVKTSYTIVSGLQTGGAQKKNIINSELKDYNSTCTIPRKKDVRLLQEFKEIIQD
jgi:hypothetical protein